jgi:hypothetical protein
VNAFLSVNQLKQKEFHLLTLLESKKTKQSERNEVRYINIPANWWTSISSIDNIKRELENKPLEIFTLKKRSNHTSNPSPGNDNWNIRQGDHHVTKTYKKLSGKAKFGKTIEKVELAAVITLSSMLVIVFSYFISKI